MDRVTHKLYSKVRRQHRVRTMIVGDGLRPRMTVHVSNKHISAQIIDDRNHKTLAHVSTVGAKDAGKTMMDHAKWAGVEIAKKAKAQKIKKVVFDRGSRLYHGRVKALADSAREGGLEF